MWVKNQLFKIIIQLLSINTLSYFILFLTSIIIFRTVDKSFYGLYVIMLSLFSIVELLMAGFNDSIVRFLKDKIPLKDKQEIVLFVLLYKYLLIFIFILCIFIARQYGFLEYLIGNYDEVSNVVDSFLLVVIINGIISIFIGINSAILNSQQKYKYTANTALIRNIFYLLVVISLSFYTKNYLHYLYSNLTISLVLLILLSVKIFKSFKEFSLLNIIKAEVSIDVGKKYILLYASPLTASSLLTYTKNHLPILVLGKEFNLDDVAVFSILKTFFKALHSLSGSFINPMMSKFIDLKNNANDFSKKIRLIFFGTFLLRFLLLILLSLLIQYLFWIYKIENNEVNRFVYYVLGVEYLIAGMILVYGIILRLDKTTTKVLFASLIRFAVELSLIYLILIDFGIMAAALILLFARYIETLVTYLFIRKQRIFYFSGMLLLCFSFVISYYMFQLLGISL
jgi:O-antigen/teichoic acid export membrane protein